MEKFLGKIKKAKYYLMKALKFTNENREKNLINLCGVFSEIGEYTISELY